MLEAAHVTDNNRTLGDFDFAGDDHVVPFEVAPLDVRGRIVQMGPMLDQILSRHDYPAPVARLLAEASVLTVLLGTMLKFDGKLILQTRSDGPVDLLVADFTAPRSLRAYARFDQDRLDAAVAAGETSPEALLGEGVLAFTIDQGPYMQRYQGIVQLDGSSMEDVARAYFRQSEQISTDVRGLRSGPARRRVLVFARQDPRHPRRLQRRGDRRQHRGRRHPRQLRILLDGIRLRSGGIRSGQLTGRGRVASPAFAQRQRRRASVHHAPARVSSPSASGRACRARRPGCRCRTGSRRARASCSGRP